MSLVLHLAQTGHASRVYLDGHDVSHYVYAVTVTTAADDVTYALLECIPTEVIAEARTWEGRPLDGIERLRRRLAQ